MACILAEETGSGTCLATNVSEKSESASTSSRDASEARSDSCSLYYFLLLLIRTDCWESLCAKINLYLPY